MSTAARTLANGNGRNIPIQPAPSSVCEISASRSRPRPSRLGTYVEAVQTGNLLFLTGMLPTEGRPAKFKAGRVGAELDLKAGRGGPLTLAAPPTFWQ